MCYIDGFIFAVENRNKQAFIDYANRIDVLFKEYGALRVMESWGDDVPDGKSTDFKKAVHAREGESVVFSWVEWPSKRLRNEAMEKMIKDPRMNPENDPMLFDGARLIFGGFSTVVKL